MRAVQELGALKRLEVGLRRQEEHYRGVFEDTGLIVAGVDRDLRYVWICDPHPDFDADAVVGKLDIELADNEGTRALMELKSEVLDTGRVVVRRITFPLPGGPRTYTVKGTPLRDDHDRVAGLTTVAVDVTAMTRLERAVFDDDRARLAVENAQLYRMAQMARRDAERRAAQLQVQVDRIQALYEIDAAITGDPDLRTVLSVLLERVATHLEADAAQVLVRETEGWRLGAGLGFWFPESSSGRLVVPAEFLEAPWQRRTTTSTHTDGLGTPRRDLFEREGFVTAHSVPLVAQNQLVGVLEVFLRTPHEPDEDWSYFLEVLARQAAIAVKSANSLIELRRSHEALLASYDATLRGWVHALDLRDQEVEGHSQRVTAMMRRFAPLAGVAESELADVVRGALLHDIGKIGVADSILRKAGPLDDEERGLMRRHPIYARDWLRSIPFLLPAIEIPYEHHERWDGRGYPRGLAGEAISLAARAFALIDVYDALRSDRPYRPAQSVDRARRYLSDQAGLHFDPRLVGPFLAIDWE
jgi:HD-GYP domain-containing protein (c-di-GMP phosphodiesterase class II)